VGKKEFNKWQVLYFVPPFIKNVEINERRLELLKTCHFLELISP